MSAIYSALLPAIAKESKPKVARHKWGEKKATFRSVRMRCQKCGLERDAKSNDDGYHWMEFRMKDETWAKQEKTPECKPYMTVRRFDLEARANAKGYVWSGERWVKTDPTSEAIMDEAMVKYDSALKDLAQK